MNTFNYVVVVIFFQKDDNDILRLITFMLKKMLL